MPRSSCQAVLFRVSAVTLLALGAATSGLLQEEDAAAPTAAAHDTRLWFPLLNVPRGARLLLTNHETLPVELRLIGLPDRHATSLVLQAGSTVSIDPERVFPAAKLIRLEAEGRIDAHQVAGGLSARGGVPGLAEVSHDIEFQFEPTEDVAERRLTLINPSARTARGRVIAGHETGQALVAEVRIPPGEVASVSIPLASEPMDLVRVRSDVGLSGLVSSFTAAGDLQSVAVGTQWLGPAWSWPLDDGRAGHGYAQLGARIKDRYHTGLDIQAPSGTHIRAAASGTLVKIQGNGGFENGGSEDHGFGNTVIIRSSDSLFGYPVYMQYSHLDSVEAGLLSACGPVERGKKYRRTCTRSAAVYGGQVLGVVGSTGGGGRYTYGANPHLHFEVKSFDTLGPRGDASSGPDYGYSSNHPDTPSGSGARYFNPLLRLHQVRANLAAVPLRSRIASNTLMGPGGRGEGEWPEYDVVGRIGAGEELYGWVQASATQTPWCGSGWYLVRRRSGASFSDWRSFSPKPPTSPTLPEVWICSDALDSSGGSGPAPTPTPTPTPQPTPRSSAPQVSQVSPTSIVGSDFTMTIQGSGFDPSGASAEVYQPNGSYMGSGAITSRTATRITARQSMAGAAPGTYSVRVRNANGALSNAASFSLYAQVSVSPASGPAGTQFGYGGAGFTARYGVTSHLRRPNRTEFPTLQIPTDSRGRFSHTVNSSGFAPGAYELWAVDNNTGHVTGRVTFRVQ